MRRQVVAIGGGGFSMEPDNPLLDEFVLKCSGKSKPKICFLGTASGDAPEYAERFYRAFQKHSCEPSDLSLFRAHTPKIKEFLQSQDIIYVGGGNTRNLLTLWRDWGIDEYLKQAYQQGTVMAGISAGAICWFEKGVTDSNPGSLSGLSCLGWLPGSCCPHFDGEADRRPATQKLLQEQSLPAGIAIDDGAAVHYVNETLQEVVCSHPEKAAYFVSCESGQYTERTQAANYLGGESLLIRRACVADIEGIHRAHMESINTICIRDHSEDEIRGWGGRSLNREHRTHAVENENVWVVELNGKIEGYGHLVIKGEPLTAYLNGLYFTQAVTGRGLGARILKLCEARVLEAGLTTMNLHSTLTSLAFYQKQGYLPTGKEARVEVNGSQVRCIPMSKELTV